MVDILLLMSHKMTSTSLLLEQKETVLPTDSPAGNVEQVWFQFIDGANNLHWNLKWQILK